MSKGEIISADMKKYVPKWLIGFGGSLMFISLFLNSIGFNLMAVNTALTEHLIKGIKEADKDLIALHTTELMKKHKIIERLIELEAGVRDLKEDSHSPTENNK